MQTIVLASQKGGAGKTTLAAHLAVAAELSGKGPVALIDTDPQGTLKAWWTLRQANSPAMDEVPVAGLGAKLREITLRGIALVIIDTPPAITASIRSVIKLADLVLLPVRPSPADLWSIGSTVALCREQGKPFAFAITQATRGALLTVQAIEALSKHGAVSEATIHNRVGYAGALASGQALQELAPRGSGANEIATLLAFVLKRLDAAAPPGPHALKGRITR